MNDSPENHLISLTAAAQAANDPDMRRDLAEQLCQAIEQAGLDTTPATRARAGDCLAALGDPRFDPQRWFLPRDATLGFVHIPAGKFWMGQDNSLYDDELGEESGRYHDEKPEHEVTLPDFWLARYPVTVAQFRAFSNASGYAKFNPDALRDPDTRPVRFITWCDALAYCAWLQEQMLPLCPVQRTYSRADSPEYAFWQGLAAGELGIGLPSEAEWEKAARGPDEACIYPWGNDFDSNLANTEATRIDTTSAVGCFPGGASPYGLLDLGGNIWEWTRSIGQYRYPYDPQDKKRENLQAAQDQARVLRGGAYFYYSDGARCANRLTYDPGPNFHGRGFRVVCSPFFAR
jgi:formylglycine-generating enzyme required for sulfatase activity